MFLNCFLLVLAPQAHIRLAPCEQPNVFLSSRASLGETVRVQLSLFGSLALTGKGHGTDMAIIMGLMGESPDTIDPITIPQRLAQVYQHKQLKLLGQQSIDFIAETDLLFFYQESLPHHANGMRFACFDNQGTPLAEQVFYSVGGGFVVSEQEYLDNQLHPDPKTPLPYPYKTAAQLLGHCQNNQTNIAQIVRENEHHWRNDTDINQGLLAIWKVMEDSIQRGCEHSGILPGGLQVKRRAPELFRKLAQLLSDPSDRQDEMTWINLFALAVNERKCSRWTNCHCSD